MNLDIFLIILSSIFLGMSINKWWVSITTNITLKKKKEEKNKKFVQILENLKSNPTKAEFKSRVNGAIYIQTEISEHNKVDLIYLVDKDDVAIFKNDDCLFTSEDIERKTIDEIIKVIRAKFENQINDVVSVLGITFGREEFERAFGLKSEDIKKLFNFSQSESEIDKIYFDNEMKYDIDEILDRINIVGINNLTKAELDFLRKWGNEKGN